MALPKKTSNKLTPTIKKNENPYMYPHIYVCHCCEKKYFEPTNFYKTTGNIDLSSGNNGYVHICKSCIQKYFDELKGLYGNERAATAIICSTFNWYWSEKLYLEIKEDKRDDFTFGNYLKKICIQPYKNLSFRDTLIEIMQEDKVLLNLDESRDEIERKAFSEEEFSARSTVVEVVGYDPFEEHSAMDRKYLFKELIKYFDEDISEDAYKLSMIIQLVINNNQIRRIDNQIAVLSPLSNADEIAKLNCIKKDLVLSNDKIAKENEISVKNRSNKEPGRNTLTFLMKKLRELNFEKAEEDYYAQLKSKASRWAIDMSMQAISENAYFDENDWREIGDIRREIVDELQNENDELKEKNRLLHKEIMELKNQLQEIEQN